MKLRIAWEILLLLTMILVLVSLWSWVKVDVQLDPKEKERLERIEFWMNKIADQLYIDLAD